MITPVGFEPHDEKPRLRGVIHQWAAVVALFFGVMLVYKAAEVERAMAAGIYSFSLITLFSVSATYHRIKWGPRARLLMRRLDHAAIFILIAGTYTPIALVALGPGEGTRLFAVSWTCAVIGILKSIFWPGSPKWVTAAIAIVAGWCLLPYLGALRLALDGMQLFLFLGGGVLYTLGALAYAAKRPNPIVGVFGYHEVFHAFTVVAAGMHFAAVVMIIGKA